MGCPIVREEDGLAMSSRNTYLDEKERKAALILHKSLMLGEEMMRQGERNTEVVKNAIVQNIKTEPLAKVDYVEIVDSENLEPVAEMEHPVLVAIAVYIGNTRLIDNFSFEP